MYTISDEQLFTFFKDNQKKLYRFAIAYVKNEEDAKDILQNSIIKAYRKCYQIHSVEKLPGWFYRILINECLMFLRKNKHHEIPLEMDVFPCKSQDYLQVHQLRKMILQLDGDSQMIIILRFFEEQKLSEIADILNLPLSTVKSKLYKSLHDLRIHLEDDALEK